MGEVYVTYASDLDKGQWRSNTGMVIWQWCINITETDAVNMLGEDKTQAVRKAVIEHTF